MKRKASYATGPIKRSRRTQMEMEALKDGLCRLVEEHQPATIRNIFYLAAVSKLVAKTQAEYKSTVCRLLGQLREEGRIPFEWITDNTRWMRKPRAYSGLQDAVEHFARTYRRDLWLEADSRVEVWCESDSIAGVLFEETHVFDVPLMPTKGYSSKTFTHAAAQAIKGDSRPAVIYYVGDYDPSGKNIGEKLEADLRRYSGNAELHFERLAVTPEQIERWNLPSNPAKQTDSRSKSFKGEAVEAEAIPPREMRALLRRALERHLPPWKLAQIRKIEAEERQTLRSLKLFGGVA